MAPSLVTPSTKTIPRRRAESGSHPRAPTLRAVRGERVSVDRAVPGGRMPGTLMSTEPSLRAQERAMQPDTSNSTEPSLVSATQTGGPGGRVSAFTAGQTASYCTLGEYGAARRRERLAPPGDPTLR